MMTRITTDITNEPADRTRTQMHHQKVSGRQKRVGYEISKDDPIGDVLADIYTFLLKDDGNLEDESEA